VRRSEGQLRWELSVKEYPTTERGQYTRPKTGKERNGINWGLLAKEKKPLRKLRNQGNFSQVFGKGEGCSAKPNLGQGDCSNVSEVAQRCKWGGGKKKKKESCKEKEKRPGKL